MKTSTLLFVDIAEVLLTVYDVLDISPTVVFDIKFIVEFKMVPPLPDVLFSENVLVAGVLLKNPEL